MDCRLLRYVPRRTMRNSLISRSIRAWYVAYGGQNASTAFHTASRSSPSSRRALTGMSSPCQLMTASGWARRLAVQAG